MDRCRTIEAPAVRERCPDDELGAHEIILGRSLLRKNPDIEDCSMDDTTLRLRARVTILEQLTVRLFAILGTQHANEVRTVVTNLDEVVKSANESDLFGADLNAEDRNDLFNKTTNEWAWIRAQILDPMK